VQQIIGNDALVNAIESKSLYRFVVPQRFEQVNHENLDAIRNQDLNALLACDGVLINADGTDLDDGMVVEFMVGKTAAKPTVINTTDYRRFSVDTLYNLMLLSFPATVYINSDALAMYRKHGDNLINVVADQIIIALDQAFALPNPEGVSIPRVRELYNIATPGT
ncbi:Nucleoside 2-deoxyribosyltransferase, partial [uncultured virus]